MKAADLSLAGASDQISLGDMYPRATVFTGNSPVPPPPPLAHHQPYEETFYNNSGLNSEYLGGEGHLGEYDENLTQYSDYYSRYTYTDTLQVNPGTGVFESGLRIHIILMRIRIFESVYKNMDPDLDPVPKPT